AGLPADVPVPAQRRQGGLRQLRQPARDRRPQRRDDPVEPARGAGHAGGASTAGRSRGPGSAGPAGAARRALGPRAAAAQPVRLGRTAAGRWYLGRLYPAPDPHREVSTVISRLAKLQVLVFLVVSLLGIAYVGLRYVGVGEQLIGGEYLLH